MSRKRLSRRTTVLLLPAGVQITTRLSPHVREQNIILLDDEVKKLVNMFSKRRSLRKVM